MKPFPFIRVASDDDLAKVTSPSTKMTVALGATGKTVYGGTVYGAERARCRRRNKAARIARRAAR